MSDDELVESMCVAAWEVRRKWANQDEVGVELPPWGQTEPRPGENPFYFCAKECWDQCREEMREALAAIRTNILAE